VPTEKNLPVGLRFKKLECRLILEPAEMSYGESWDGGAYGVSMDRSELATLRVELMDRDRYVRIVTPDRGDLGLRLPHPLGLHLLAWLNERPS
jgi:hypothetical protein